MPLENKCKFSHSKYPHRHRRIPSTHMSVHTAHTHTQTYKSRIHWQWKRALLLWLALHISETRLPRCRWHSLSPGFVELLQHIICINFRFSAPTAGCRRVQGAGCLANAAAHSHLFTLFISREFNIFSNYFSIFIFFCSPTCALLMPMQFYLLLLFLLLSLLLSRFLFFSRYENRTHTHTHTHSA